MRAAFLRTCTDEVGEIRSLSTSSPSALARSGMDIPDTSCNARHVSLSFKLARSLRMIGSTMAGMSERSRSMVDKAR